HKHTTHTNVYPLSLHDALPICSFQVWKDLSSVQSSAEPRRCKNRIETTESGGARYLLVGGEFPRAVRRPGGWAGQVSGGSVTPRDRKSTRLNSSHGSISYAVFC